MDNKNIRKRLMELVEINSQNKEIITITDDTDLMRDLYYNSIATVKLVVDIEQEFEIEFPDEFFFLDTIRRFSSLYNVVYKCILDNNI